MWRLRVQNPKSIIRNVVGATLIEVVVATAIMGLVVTAIYTVLQSGITGWRTGELRYEVHQNLRGALDRISRELRESTGSAVLVEPNPLTGTLSDDSVLAFKSARKIGDEKRIVFRADADCPAQVPLDYRPCWQAYIAYFLTEEAGGNGPYVLRRQVIPLSSPDAVLPSVSSSLNASAARPVAWKIGDFLAIRNSDGSVDIALEATAVVPNLPAQSLLVTLRTGPRNP